MTFTQAQVRKRGKAAKGEPPRAGNFCRRLNRKGLTRVTWRSQILKRCTGWAQLRGQPRSNPASPPSCPVVGNPPEPSTARPVAHRTLTPVLVITENVLPPVSAIHDACRAGASAEADDKSPPDIPASTCVASQELVNHQQQCQ